MLTAIDDIDTTLPTGFSPDLLETIRNLIAYFVLRQQLVVLAMVSFNPRNLNESFDIDLEPYLEAQHQRYLDLKKMLEEKGPDAGGSLPIWKSDWECFPHGAGCRLTHLQTGERIEWDGPDNYAFRIDWFLNHLRWRLENELDDPYVHICNEWMKTNSADLKVIEKAINCLIDLGIIVIRQNHTCKLVSAIITPTSQTSQLSSEVINAAINTLTYYQQRQQLAVDAMADLRPDFIVQVAQDPYTMPDAADRLKKLYQHLDNLPVPGSKIQTGKWRDIWEYDIRYATCTLSHPTTEEIIRWSTADVFTVDYHGYIQHLLWRFQTNSQESDLQLLYQWMAQHSEEGFDVLSRLGHLIAQLTALNIITLTRNEKGLLIRRNSYHLENH